MARPPRPPPPSFAFQSNLKGHHKLYAKEGHGPPGGSYAVEWTGEGKHEGVNDAVSQDGMDMAGQN